MTDCLGGENERLEAKFLPEDGENLGTPGFPVSIIMNQIMTPRKRNPAATAPETSNTMRNGVLR